MDHDLNMMLRTPVAHSPNQSTGSALEHEVTRVKVTTSGSSTPTLAIRGDPTRMSLASKKSEIEEEFWDNQHANPNSVIPEVLKVDEETPGNGQQANGEAVKDREAVLDGKGDGNNPVSSDNESNSVRSNLLNSDNAS